MSIQELINRGAGIFSGIFRTNPSRRARSERGCPYLRFGLKDESRNLRARGWDDQYSGPVEIPKGGLLRVTGYLKFEREHWVANIYRAELLPEAQPAQACLPAGGLQAEEEFRSLIGSLSLAPLRSFVQAVMMDPAIGPRFVRIPASRDHHHDYVGGLLDHSLECAQIVSGCSRWDRFEAEVGIVAALLHDAGKVWTFQLDGRKTPVGWLVGHDDLTLEVLASHLANLDRTCPDAAIALRHIWSWLGERTPRPHSPLAVAEMVLTADHLSCDLNIRRRAFNDAPEGWRIGRWGGRRYFRPCPALRTIEIEPERENPNPEEDEEQD